ncbi:MAG: radical SAM protein [Ardenticatenaceae bacterium]|nr:radical SAM protein [Anaerolineales bacterium]MCB8938702.1 radical SAM protein [Ardenticatenaceae bacterium]MCB8973938.1 radical SAM protein [Ardenticatenaceae bacterium]
MSDNTSRIRPFLIFAKKNIDTSSDMGRASSSVTIHDDCACPDDGFAPMPATLHPGDFFNKRFSLPQLHQEQLDDTHALLFNPHGQTGVVLLNQASLELLNQFQTPRTLTDAVLTNCDLPGGLAAAQQLVQLGLLQPEGLVPQPQRGQPQTLTAWLHVTNACNLRCPYCYLHKTPDQMELAHGRFAIEAIFRSATNNNFRRVKIKYAGGEATLNMKTVLALHRYAQELADLHELELTGVILSNGVAFSARIIEAIEQSGLRLMISLDGVGEVHDAQRHFANGAGSFAHVERTLDRLQVAGLTPTISITVTNRTLHGLADTVRYVLKRKLPFSLNFFRENECAAPVADLPFSEKTIIEAMEEAFAVIESDLPRHSLLGAIIDRARLDTLHDRPCGVGQNYLVIDQNGQVAKCQMEIEQPITDVRVHDPLAAVRADTIHLQNPSVDEKEGCRSCHWRYWCAGGCPALTYRATGRFDVKSPNCNIYKSLFPAVLRLEALRLLKYAV